MYSIGKNCSGTFDNFTANIKDSKPQKQTKHNFLSNQNTIPLINKDFIYWDSGQSPKINSGKIRKTNEKNSNFFLMY